MIAGIGVDVVDMKRVGRLHDRWGKRLERRVLSQGEIDRLPGEAGARRRRIALAFAAKEAFAKAYGTGLRWPVTLHQVRVGRDGSGAPTYGFGAALRDGVARRGITGAHLSLSDDGGSAVAVALLESGV